MTGIAADHADRMDRNYRFQRHIYDATRRHYLIGRDRLIEDLQPPVGGRVLEIGCGTARNLIAAAERYPSTQFFGVDISTVMLETASGGIARRGLSNRIRLSAADAATLDAGALFGVGQFDRVFLSYSISMIPDWRGALATAVAHVAPGGALHVVDFGPMRTMPGAARALLRLWLRHFSVTPRVDLGEELEKLARLNNCASSSDVFGGEYAVYRRLTRRREAA